MEKINAPINIVVVALSEKFSKAIASSLANRLDMFMVDCHEMIVYDLIDPKDVLDRCGIEYFKKRERSVVRNCAEFYNTVVSINYELLKEYQNLFTSSLVFYVKLPKDKIEQIPSFVSYENRDENLTKISNENVIELNKRSPLQAVEKIINKLGEYYENC